MKTTESNNGGSLKRVVRRLVGFKTDSESPSDFCEECMDTGWGGDHGPGWRGNNEVGPCACNEQKRARRNIARRYVRVKPPNGPDQRRRASDSQKP